MALGEHFREARKRLLIAASSVIVGTIAGVFVYTSVLEALARPIQNLNEREGSNASLIFDAVASPLDLMIQVSVFLGIILSSPVWLYQLWAFIAPGLRVKEPA